MYEYQVRIEHDGYDAEWFTFDYESRIGEFIASVLPTFDGEVTVTVRKLEKDAANE